METITDYVELNTAEEITPTAEHEGAHVSDLPPAQISNPEATSRLDMQSLVRAVRATRDARQMARPTTRTRSSVRR